MCSVTTRGRFVTERSTAIVRIWDRSLLTNFRSLSLSPACSGHRLSSKRTTQTRAPIHSYCARMMALKLGSASSSCFCCDGDWANFEHRSNRRLMDCCVSYAQISLPRTDVVFAKEVELARNFRKGKMSATVRVDRLDRDSHTKSTYVFCSEVHLPNGFCDALSNLLSMTFNRSMRNMKAI